MKKYIWGIITFILLLFIGIVIRIIYLNSVNQFDPNYEVFLENAVFLKTPILTDKIKIDRYNIPTIEAYTNRTPNVLNRIVMYNTEIMESEFSSLYRYYYRFCKNHQRDRNYQIISYIATLPNINGKSHCLLITNLLGGTNKKSIFIAWDNTIPQKSDNDIWDYRSNYCSITETTRIIYSNLDKAELQKVFPEFDGIVKNYYPKKITINYEKMPKSSEDNIDEHIQFEW